MKYVDKLTENLQPGLLEWIGLRPHKKAPMVTAERVMLIENRGVEGDHQCLHKPGSARQITLISREFIDQICLYLNIEQGSIDPLDLRRNLVVSGINLNALRQSTFAIGNAVLQATAVCHPCSRMEASLGQGGFAAMLGHGGLCAKIVSSGEIALGHAVTKLSQSNNNNL